MTVQIEANEEQLIELAKRFHVKELYAFGSAVSGEYKAGESDLDFLVSFGDCTPAESAERYFGLLAALQDLFDTRVDLVEMEAVTNPHFQNELDESRVAVYAERNG